MSRSGRARLLQIQRLRAANGWNSPSCRSYAADGAGPAADAAVAAVRP
ncbi:hypothetical protein [Microbacterium testaceum]